MTCIWFILEHRTHMNAIDLSGNLILVPVYSILQGGEGSDCDLLGYDTV
jgi:hypothetical protein